MNTETMCGVNRYRLIFDRLEAGGVADDRILAAARE